MDLVIVYDEDFPDGRPATDEEIARLHAGYGDAGRDEEG